MAMTKSAAVPERSATTLDSGTSDGELLRRFNSRRDGSAEAAFEALVRRHGPMVLRVCGQILANRHGAEDAFQATFLVLARKAGSIRRPESLGNWLYGVALRTAREAKMRDGRIRRLEEPAAEGVLPEPTGDANRPEVALICREEFEVLHEEVARLPERYRIPVVLCELEGLTYEEVARRMHCPVGTIGVRLLRARERLRSRLIRRGIAPAAALIEALSGGGGASALMSSVLIDSTVRGASVFAISGALPMACVSSSAAGLTDAVLGALALARIKVVTSSFLMAALVGAGAWLGAHRQPAAPSISRTGPASGPKMPSPVAPVVPVVRDESSEPGGPVAPAPVEAPKPAAPAVDVLRLAREQRARGEALFFKEWIANDPASPHGDGLGPVFNETSCVACHGLGAPGGAGPESKNVVILSVVLGGRRPPKGLEKVHPGLAAARSTVLHRYGTDPSYASWRRQVLGAPNRKAQGAQADPAEETVEARIARIAAQAGPKGRLGEHSTNVNPAAGINLRISERNTPALFGAGRIDSISSEAIAREAKWQPAGIQGRVSRDRDGRVGRFGWKAQVSRLHEFVRVACAGELGLEVPGHSQSPSPLAPLEKARGIDMTEGECDELVSFVRALPAPVAIDPEGPHGTEEMVEGRRLFGNVGCASCHVPSLGDVRGIYSDLLLHEMGQSLSDSGEYYGSGTPDSPGGPSPGEWRTPPLWGYRDSGPYLHDGRAETLEEAVALHGGQGTKAARAFFALTARERSCVETFLKSLVAPSSASTPGVLLASELEARILPEQDRQEEILIRTRQDEVEAREAERRREARRKQETEVAAKLILTRFRMASSLERSGKTIRAIEYYEKVAQEAPDTAEGRSAAERIAALKSANPSR